MPIENKESGQDTENLEISEANSFEDNLKIGAQLLEKEREEESGNQSDDDDEEDEDDGDDGGAGNESDEEDEDDDLDWSKAPPELKKAYRRKIKEAKAEKQKVANAAQTVQRLLEKVEQIQEGKQAKKDSEESGDADFDPNNPPDKDLDPDAYEEWEREKDRRERAEERAERAVQQAETHMGKSAKDVSQDLMDYSRGLFRRGIKAQYPNAGDSQVEKAIDTMMLEVAYVAKQNGQTFADYLKQRAEVLGYEEGKGKSAKRQGTGRVNMDEAIKNSEKKSLGEAGGGESKGEKTIEDLLEMDNEELDKFMTENPKEFRKITEQHALQQ